MWVILFALLVEKTNTLPLTSKPEDKSKPINVNKVIKLLLTLAVYWTSPRKSTRILV